MDEHAWQEDVGALARMTRRARAILGVRDGAAGGEIKRAFRRAARRHHPDRNPGDPGAAARFRDAVAAYRLLARGEPDRRLLREPGAEPEAGTDPKRSPGGFRLDNDWGYFLWWRENFFSEDEDEDEPEA